MSKLVFLEPGTTFTQPRKVAKSHYTEADVGKRLPAKGEDVWVDHPFFEECRLFRALLFARVLDIPAAAMGGSKERAEKTRYWIDGSNPIPPDELEELIELREEIAAEDGITDLLPAREDELPAKDLTGTLR